MTDSNFEILLQAKLDTALSTSEINKQLKTLKINPIDLTAKFDTASFQKQVDSATKATKPKVSVGIDVDQEEIKKFKEQLNLENLGFDKVRLSSNIQTWMQNNTEAAEVFKDRLADLLVQVENVDSRAGLTNVTKNFQSMKAEAQSMGVTATSAFNSLASSAQKFLSLFVGGSVLTLIVRQLNQMVSNVTELNSAMLELRKVTDLTETQYVQFLDNATERAVKLGASITDVVNASADFSRLGYSVDEASTLADIAILYTNVGDELSGLSEATTSIISTMKAFNIEAENSIQIVDKFNSTGRRNKLPLNNYIGQRVGTPETEERLVA